MRDLHADAESHAYAQMVSAENRVVAMNKLHGNPALNVERFDEQVQRIEQEAELWRYILKVLESNPSKPKRASARASAAATKKHEEAFNAAEFDAANAEEG